MRMVITYPESARYYGRNKHGDQHGLLLLDFGGHTPVRLHPVTSHGTPTESCHLEIPLGAIPALIAHLEAIRDGKTRTGAYGHVDLSLTPATP